MLCLIILKGKTIGTSHNNLNQHFSYAPGFKSSIVGKEVLPPPDLERIFGLTGGKIDNIIISYNSLIVDIQGNIFHGSMSLDQLYLARPTPDPSPVANLLMCGAGAHPGGGVMGSPGRIAAKRAGEMLRVNWKFS